MGRSLRKEAEIEGVKLNYKYIEFIPNSMEAHRIVWLVEDKHHKYDLAMRLFYGYFEEGQNIEDPTYLLEQARQVGVSEEVLQQFQYSDAGLQDCENYIQSARDNFIQLVPTLKLDGRFTVLGLQSDEVLEKYIRRAAQKQQP